MENVLSSYDINLPQDKINALHDIEKLISEVYSRAEQDIYINSVSKKFDVKYDNIRSDIDKLIRKNQQARKKAETEKLKNSAIGYGDRVNPDFAKAPEVAKNEENVLGLILLYPEHRKKILKDGELSENDFFTEFGKRVFAYSMNLEEQGESVDINLLFSPEEMGRITKMKLARMNLSDNGDEVFFESVKMLKDSLDKKNAVKLSSVSDLDSFLNNIRNK